MYSQSDIKRVRAIVIMKRATARDPDEICPFKKSHGTQDINTCRKYCAAMFPKLAKERDPWRYPEGPKMRCPCMNTSSIDYIKNKFRKIFMRGA